MQMINLFVRLNILSISPLYLVVKFVKKKYIKKTINAFWFNWNKYKNKDKKFHRNKNCME